MKNNKLNMIVVTSVLIVSLLNVVATLIIGYKAFQHIWLGQ